jgi:dihydrofolate synthase/folylpolyglutamate synthase
LDGQAFNLSGKTIQLNGLEIKLLGEYQIANAATAALAVIELRKQNYNIADENIRAGLGQASWPGRMELIRREPPVLIDCAHNPQGAEALAASVRKYLGGRPVCLVMGAMADKDAEPMAGYFSEFASRAIATLPPSQGRLRHAAGGLAEMFESRGVPAAACPDWRRAMSEALGSGMAVVVAGSLYLAGAARTWLMEKVN